MHAAISYAWHIRCADIYEMAAVYDNVFGYFNTFSKNTISQLQVPAAICENTWLYCAGFYDVGRWCCTQNTI